METKKISAYFECLNEDDAPLYLSLRKGMEAMIADMEDGALFPSERELAELLNVNRRTLRKALEPILAKGILKRRRHETFVGKSAAARNGAHKEGHDGAFGGTSLHPFTEIAVTQKRTMRILLYEMLPFQQRFWQEMIDGFNRISPEVELEAVYPPGAPTEKYGLGRSYWDAFFRGGFDLAHVPVAYACPPEMEALCRTVDPVLREQECGASFLSGVIAASIPGFLDTRIPFAFNFILNNWNRTYFPLCGCADDASFEEKLAAGVKTLPPDVCLMHEYYNLCADLGVLEDFSRERIQQQCRIILNRLELLRGRGNPFRNNHPAKPSLMSDEPGGLLFRPMFSMLRAVSSTELERDYFPELIRPREGCKYWGGFESLIIHRDTENYHAARLFIAYLLSEPVQRRIWEMIRMAPVLRDALDSLDFAPAGEVETFLEHCRQNPKEHLPPVGLVMLPYFEDYLAGRMTGERILGDVLEFYGADSRAATYTEQERTPSRLVFSGA